jgi:hypothetical protein
MWVQVEAVLWNEFGEAGEAFPGPPHTEGSILGTARRHEPCSSGGEQNRSAEAIALLAPIYNRFTEGFETADLKTAKALIDGFYSSKGNNRRPLSYRFGAPER